MTFKSSKIIIAMFFLMLPIAGNLMAQGVIIPRPCPILRCPGPIPRPFPLPNVLPVKSIELDTKIKGQVAITRVVQVFKNHTQFTLEGTYFFPIPEDAAIEQFAIWENGKKLVGEVRSRDEARKIYDKIVRSMRDPGLLEYAGKNLFQASIFPILPHAEKKLEIIYSQVLKAESGTVAYRYPLGTGRNLWSRRPIPIPIPGPIIVDKQGTSRSTTHTPQKFGTVSGKIEISGKNALRNIYSPSHKVDVKQNGDNKATISFETKGDPSDFALFYGLSDKDFGMSLMTYREAGKDGYFLMMLSPKDDIAETAIVNKDIVFVIDTSGSMSSKGKLDKAKKALQFGIDGLRKGDRFNVINFAGEDHLLESGLIAADASGQKKGGKFVEALEAKGGTNINDALQVTLKQFDNSDRPKMLVFLTDGLPTVGEKDIDKIITNVEKIGVKGLRLFPFGVGYDVNTRLLDKLAAENSGDADYVEPNEDIEVKVSNFFAKVNYPVLSDLELDFGSVETDLIYPRKITDIFKGTQLTMIGRYKNSRDISDAVFKLTGKSGKRTSTNRYAGLEFPLRASKNEFLPRLWATRRVGWLVEQARSNGENKEIRDEIVALGTRYGIVTPYTSFLATDGSVTINRDMISALPPKARSPIGIRAVQASKKAKAQQNQVSNIADKDDFEERFSRDGVPTVKRVGTKTFYLRDGVWFDSEFKDESNQAEHSVKFASEEYFELVIKHKELSKFFAIGEKVVVVFEGKVYRIIE